MGGYVLEDGRKLQTEQYIEHLESQLERYRVTLIEIASLPTPGFRRAQWLAREALSDDAKTMVTPWVRSSEHGERERTNHPLPPSPTPTKRQEP